MKIIIQFLERQSYWISNIIAPIVVIGSICFVAGLITSENDNPVGYLLITLALWCFYIKLICELFKPNEQGESKVGSSTLFMQLYSLAFFIIALGILVLATTHLISGLVS